MTVASGPERPTALRVNPDAIPDALKAIPHWVVWRYVREEDPETHEVDWDKPPVNARTGGLASSTDPETWATCAEALALYQRGGVDGVGIVLHRTEEEGDAEGLVGIDLDQCRDPKTGAVEDWAQQIIREVNSYTEASPSGAGVRIFALGKLPPKRRRKGHFEVYETARYVTVTGQHVKGAPLSVEQRQAELEALHARIFGPQAERPKATPVGGGLPADSDTAELVERAKRSKGGAKFEALWNGSTDGYASASEADLALVGRLAFWLGPNPDRIDAAFRESGLFRTKWQRADYRERTIAKALEGRSDFYRVNGSPRRERARPNASASVNGDGRPAEALDGHAIIHDFFEEHYQPVFRKGLAFYSARLRRLVPRQEALGKPLSPLIERLTEARDAPRSKEGVVLWAALPKFFRDWAPTSLADLLEGLPEEECSPEIVESAQVEFRGLVSAAILTQVVMAQDVTKGKEVVTSQQKRSLLSWCQLWAKTRAWAGVRSYQLWCMRGQDRRVRIALRHELFSQINAAKLAEFAPERFLELAKMYGVAAEEGVRCRRSDGKQCRAVELHPDFLAGLEAVPEGAELQEADEAGVPEYASTG